MFLPIAPMFLRSIRAMTYLTWTRICSELTDNSFDANAMNVWMRWVSSGNVFSFEDDGVGTDDLLRMVTFGMRHSHETNNVGCYGVGGKQAIIWLWGRTVIETLHLTGAYEIAMDWERITESKDPFPTSHSIGRRAKKGTLIKCYTDRTAPKYHSFVTDMAATYTPALEQGRRIVIAYKDKTPYSLTPRRWPVCSETIDEQLEVAGRVVRLRMGIVADGHDNTYQRGFSFERDYRVIMESALGAGEFSTSKIAARITLGNDWRLSTNKDDFEEYKDEIAEAIYERCAGMMKRASEQATTIEDRAFNQELSDMLNDNIRRGRERRPNENGSESTGTVEPKETGRNRRTAQVVSDGDGEVTERNKSDGQKKRHGYRIDTYKADDDSLTYGRYDRSANRVLLNYGNEYVKACHVARDSGPLMAITYTILAEHDRQHGDREHPLFKNQTDLLSQIGGLMAAWHENETKKTEKRQ